MFPWQSGSDGTEETQVVHLNPLSGQWDPDLSHNQRHVNAAIFYNVWHYYQATDDVDVPARLRRRDDARDRPLLGLDRALQPRARPVRDPRRDGARRVPRAATRAPTRAGCATTPTRTSWWPGSPAPPSRVLDLLPSSRREALRAGSGSPTTSCTIWDGHEPQDVRPVPRRRRHQPVRGLRRPRGARLGATTARSTPTSSASTGSSAPRATTRTATSSPSRPTR